MGLVAKKDDQKPVFLVLPLLPPSSKNYEWCWWAENGNFCLLASPPSPPNDSTTTPIINTVHHSCFWWERGNRGPRTPKTHPSTTKNHHKTTAPPTRMHNATINFWKNSLAPCVGGRFQHSDGARDFKNVKRKKRKEAKTVEQWWGGIVRKEEEEEISCSNNLPFYLKNDF